MDTSQDFLSSAKEAFKKVHLYVVIFAALVSDFLQPVAQFSEFILYIFVPLGVVSLGLIAAGKVRERAYGLFMYSLVLCVIAGPLYYLQNSEYAEKGVLAGIIKPVNQLQELLLVARDTNEKANDILANTKSTVDKLDKRYNSSEILGQIHGMSDEEKINYLSEMENHGVHGAISATEFIKIYSAYPEHTRYDLIGCLDTHILPDMSADTYLDNLLKYGEKWQYAGLDRKVESKFSAQEAASHINRLSAPQRKKYLGTILDLTEVVSPLDMKVLNAVLTKGERETEMYRFDSVLSGISSYSEAKKAAYAYDKKALPQLMNENQLTMSVPEVVDYINDFEGKAKKEALLVSMGCVEPLGPEDVLIISSRGKLDPVSVMIAMSSGAAPVKQFSQAEKLKLKNQVKASAWRIFGEKLFH